MISILKEIGENCATLESTWSNVVTVPALPLTFNCPGGYTSLGGNTAVLEDTPAWEEIQLSWRIHQPGRKYSCPGGYTGLGGNTAVLEDTPAWEEIQLSWRIHQPGRKYSCPGGYTSLGGNTAVLKTR